MAGRVNDRSWDLPFEFGYLIHDVSRLRRTIVDKTLRPLRVTGAQCWVLVILSRTNGNGLLQTELAKTMELGKVSLGGLVDRLENSGHVQRKPEHGDRRANRVVLTAEGRKLLARIQTIGRELDLRIMDGVSANEMLRAATVLRKMKTRLIDMDAVPGCAQRIGPQPVRLKRWAWIPNIKKSSEPGLSNAIVTIAQNTDKYPPLRQRDYEKLKQ